MEVEVGVQESSPSSPLRPPSSPPWQPPEEVPPGPEEEAQPGSPPRGFRWILWWRTRLCFSVKVRSHVWHLYGRSPAGRN